MRIKIVLFVWLCSITAFAQKGITFQVEKLSRPTKLLSVQSAEDIYKNLILSDAHVSFSERKKVKDHFPFNILAKSQAPDSLVNFAYNSFFSGMYRAYDEHRPFVLSPDIVWLLISQGFARHVNANSESMRHYFVDFSGKQSLLVEARTSLDDPTLSWEEIVEGFSGQIKKHVKGDLVELLTCDFSTTTSLEKVVSEITIMKTVKSYFEFIVFYAGCGIPQITLEGTPDDWEKVLDKTVQLKQYGLDWWVAELKPILKEFVKASKGKIRKKFWQEMFKCHSQKKYGAPDIIDGWIVKFFPYDKHGKRNSLKQLEGMANLPEEIIKVDLKYLEVNKGGVVETPLELWAGFIGLKQNEEDFSLRPQVGWMVKKKDIENKVLKNKLNADSQSQNLGGGIRLRVKEFPSILLELKEIKELELYFIDHIDIPDALAKVRIGSLKLYGEITQEEIERIKKLLLHTEIIINNELINRGIHSSKLIMK